MKQRKDMRKLILPFAVFVLLFLLNAGTALASTYTSNFTGECEPYYWYRTEIGDVSVAGDTYKESLVFNTFNNVNGEACLDLNGNYTNFSFTAGSVNGKDAKNNRTLTIEADGKQIYQRVIGYNEIPKSASLNVTGVRQLTIRVSGSPSSFVTFLGNIQLTKKAGYVKNSAPVSSNFLQKVQAYQSTRFESGLVKMGNQSYEDALLFNTFNNVTGEASFNLKGEYASFSFLVGTEAVNEAKIQARTVSIQADGREIYSQQIQNDEIPRAATVDVSGVYQLTIKVSGSPSSFNTVLGKAKLVSNGKVRGITLDKSSLSLTKKGQTASLKAQISPSDATNKTVKWTSSKTSVAKVSSSGVVTAVGNGTATITATSADGGFKATCKVTVTLPNLRNATISIAKSTYAYTGKALKPTVTVKYNGKKLRKNSDYTVSYKNNTKVGKATITVKGKGNYTGSKTKTFAIKIDTSKAYTVGNIKYKITSTSKKTAQVVGLKSAKKSTVTIPSTVKILGTSYKVTRIYAKAFQKNKYLKTLVIGANVQTIDGKAFYGCSKLSRICVKGKVLKSVGANALRGTKSKVRVEVPRKYYSKYKKLFTKKGQTKIQFVKK